MSPIKKHRGSRGLRNNVIRPSDSLTRNTETETHAIQPEPMPLTQDLQELSDKNLIGRAHTQWQFGDWESLTQLQRAQIESHHERGKLALLVASGYLQLGERVKAEEFLNLAKEWGYNTKLMRPLLIAGVYNTLGRAAALANRQPRSIQHFENSVKVGEPGGDIRLLSQARISQQLNQLGLLPGANGRLQQVRAIAEIKNQASGCTNSQVNKLRPVDCEAAAFYENLETQEMDGGNRVPFLLLDSKSIPRSGLHYLKNTLAKLLSNHFSFCEWYREVGCCKKSPCALTGYAEHSINTGEFRVRLVKSHDLNLDDPILETGQHVQQIILVRDPLFVLTSWFTLDQLHSHHEILQQHGINIQKIWLAHEKEVLASAYRLLDAHFKDPSVEALTEWLSNKSKYIIGFMQKWVAKNENSLSPNNHIVRYEDIDRFIIKILDEYEMSIGESLKFEIDNFKSNSDKRFSSRENPFIVPSEKISAYLEKHAELFQEAANEIVAKDESGYLKASYTFYDDKRIKRINTPKKPLFVHVPKVAGSSIEQVLFGTWGKVGHKRARDIQHENPLYFDSHFSFAFIRNPFDRFVSAYAYLAKGGRNSTDREWAEKNLLPYGSFKDFVLSLKDERRRSVVLNWIHFKPQFEYVCSEDNKIIVDWIGRYESLDADFSALCQQLGRDKLALPLLNVGEPKKFQDYYEPDTEAMVRELYAKDFSLFGYPISISIDSTKQSLAQLLRLYAFKRQIIIVFANSAYREVLDYWLAGMRRLGINHILVLSLDAELNNYLNKQNVINHLVEIEDGLGNLWIKRLQIIKEIIDMGYDVIHSDADAFWLQNPLSEFFSDESYDLVFSQGTYWPIDIHEQWGFVLCCGLFMIRANSATREFLGQLQINVLETQDDQIAINRTLLEYGVEWQIPDNSYELEFNEQRFRCWPEIITGRTKSMRIALLPHGKFQRLEEKHEEDVYVKHILTQKSAISKIQSLNPSIYSQDI